MSQHQHAALWGTVGLHGALCAAVWSWPGAAVDVQAFVAPAELLDTIPIERAMLAEKAGAQAKEVHTEEPSPAEPAPEPPKQPPADPPPEPKRKTASPKPPPTRAAHPDVVVPQTDAPTPEPAEATDEPAPEATEPTPDAPPPIPVVPGNGSADRGKSRGGGIQEHASGEGVGDHASYGAEIQRIISAEIQRNPVPGTTIHDVVEIDLRVLPSGRLAFAGSGRLEVGSIVRNSLGPLRTRAVMRRIRQAAERFPRHPKGFRRRHYIVGVQISFKRG